jgi:hypothetical protein
LKKVQPIPSFFESFQQGKRQFSQSLHWVQGKVMGKKYSIHNHLKTCTFIEIDDLWITVNKDYCSKGWISVRVALCFVSGS